MQPIMNPPRCFFEPLIRLHRRPRGSTPYSIIADFCHQQREVEQATHLSHVEIVENGTAVGYERLQDPLEAFDVALVGRKSGEGQGGVREAAVLLFSVGSCVWLDGRTWILMYKPAADSWFSFRRSTQRREEGFARDHDWRIMRYGTTVLNGRIWERTGTCVFRTGSGAGRT